MDRTLPIRRATWAPILALSLVAVASARPGGANMRATEQAWPRTVAFFREHLGR